MPENEPNAARMGHPTARISYTNPLYDVTDGIVDRASFHTTMVATLEGLRDANYTPAELLEAGQRYRVRDCPYKLDAVLRADGVSVSSVEFMVRATVETALKEVTAQQQNGTWRMVAYRVSAQKQQRRARTRLERNMLKQNYSILSGLDKPMASQERLITENVVILEMVLLDVAKQGEIDNWKVRTGLDNSPMAGGRVPPKLVKEYDKARELIQAFFAAVPEVAAIRESEAGKLSQAQRDAARDLMDRGVPPDVIADLLAIDPSQVRALRPPAQSDEPPAGIVLDDDDIPDPIPAPKRRRNAANS